MLPIFYLVYIPYIIEFKPETLFFKEEIILYLGWDYGHIYVTHLRSSILMKTNKHLLETDQSKLEKSDDTIKGVNCLVVYGQTLIVKLGCP
jgi:hypothetical protein